MEKRDDDGVERDVDAVMEIEGEVRTEERVASLDAGRSTLERFYGCESATSELDGQDSEDGGSLGGI